MTALWLSRARLRRDVPLEVLARAVVGDEPGTRVGALHRLVWQLFADRPGRVRDFLWHEAAGGLLYVLSGRPPADAAGLFELETKPFAPVLRPGQRLRFRLRANPVVSVRAAPGRRGRRHDVVMHALRAVPRGERASQRFAVLQREGAAWLARQGAARGFRLPEAPRVDGYEQLRIPRPAGGPDMRISVADFSGVLEVGEPDAFLEAIGQGFGHARGFGCGLMLIAPLRR